jgi:hypothetical protein
MYHNQAADWSAILKHAGDTNMGGVGMKVI